MRDLVINRVVDRANSMREDKDSDQLLANHIQYLVIGRSRQFPYEQSVNLEHPYKLQSNDDLQKVHVEVITDHRYDQHNHQYDVYDEEIP